jgi:hypothetical protein
MGKKIEIKKLTDKQSHDWDCVREYLINECPVVTSFDKSLGEARFYISDESSWCLVLLSDGRWHLD